MPLALTDDEFAAVQAAAAPIHPMQRRAFLKALAAELESHPVVGPGVVFRAAAALQKTSSSPRTARRRMPRVICGPRRHAEPAGRFVRSYWSLWLCAMLASIDNNRGEKHDDSLH